MKNDAVRAFARQHDDVLSTWALRAAGLSEGAARHAVAGLREVHDGVFLFGASPPTRRQMWRAATLTAPDRYLSGASAGALYGFRPWEGTFEIVTAPGSGGPKRHGGLLVCRSQTLEGSRVFHAGLPALTPERVLAELGRSLGERALDRCVREALRLRVTTCPRIQARQLRGAVNNRSRRLLELAARYARLPIGRTRSDAEAYALAVIAEAGLPVPRSNVRVAGEEADLCWPLWKLIVELDGPDFHLFPDEDLRKQALWGAAGWRVERLPTDDVYDRPDRLLAIVREADVLLPSLPRRQENVRPLRA